MITLSSASSITSADERPYIKIRAIYGSIPLELTKNGKKLTDYGINAIFVGYNNLNEKTIANLKKQGVKIFAEFNTMHVARYLKEHPDAAPIGADGKICPPPHNWQGICPTHPGYRKFRMDEFRNTLKKFNIDGIWLDYHHSHASWERATPEMPDTCFCDRCIKQFSEDMNIEFNNKSKQEIIKLILEKYKSEWTRWRCNIFTDWIREFRSILNKTRPNALLGTFHCPWREDEHYGALKNKLAIDLKAQAKYIDVFSIMLYHARFGHATDLQWISRQIAWLGEYIGIKGTLNEHLKIWPIVQLSDWGEKVPPEQVTQILDYGTRSPATGIIVFRWTTLREQTDKVKQMFNFFSDITPKNTSQKQTKNKG